MLGCMKCHWVGTGSGSRVCYVSHLQSTGNGCPCGVNPKPLADTSAAAVDGKPSVSVQFEFSYFFETGTRRRCYLAPERFMEAGQAASQPDALHPTMASHTPHSPSTPSPCSQAGSICHHVV